MTGNTGFNLMDEPWIMVLGHDGQERKESISCSSKQFGRQVPPDYELRSGLWSAGELCVRHRHRDFEVA